MFRGNAAAMARITANFTAYRIKQMFAAKKT